MKEQIKLLEKLYKKASAEDKEYAEILIQWLNSWLKKSGGDVQTEDSGDHPPPPPPHG